MRGAAQPTVLSAADLADLVRGSPALVESLQSGEAQPTPDWFLDELDAARKRRDIRSDEPRDV